MTSSIGNLGSVPSAFQSAELGIRRGQSGLDQDAAQVAGASLSTDATSLVSPMVDATQQKLLVEVSARVMSITDETLGTLIDMKA